MPSKSPLPTSPSNEIPSPLRSLLIIAGSIIVAEAMIMYVLHLIPSHSFFYEGLLDTISLTIIISPVLYLFLFRPMVQHIARDKQSQEKLQRAHDELELRVEERTSELSTLNKALLQEIEERKKAEDALRQSKEKYRSIFQEAIVGIFQTTPDGKYLSVNPAMALMYGYDTPEELIASRSDIETQVYVNPNKRNEFKRLMEKQGFVEKFEYQVYRKDRSRACWSENARAVYDEKGGLLYYIGTVEDISERKNAENALRLAEKKYRGIFENIVVGIFQTSIEGKSLIVNPTLARMFGYASPDEMITALTDIEHQFYVKPARRAEFIRLLQESDSIAGFESQVYRKDRSIIWVSENARSIRDDTGNIIGFEGTTVDITDRKRAELEYRTILKSAMDGFAITDARGKFLDVNDAYCNMIGATRDELLSMSIANVEAIEKPDEIRAHIQKIRSVGYDRFETRQRRKDGNLVDVEISVNYLDIEDGRFFVFSRDITERKRTEIQLKILSSAVEQTADNIVITNREGIIEYVNRAFTETTGYQADEAIGRTPRILKSGKHDILLYQTLWETILSGNVFRTTFVNKRKTGELYWDEHTITPIKDHQGAIVHFVSTSKDFTSQKLAEQEREKLLLDLQEALANIRTLKGLIPICASCKKIRDDKGFWQQVEQFVMEHSEATFSHGVCPD
ncbi:MAG: PAS domain S-box protein, partial [Ignavibacteriae bacterium]|nr:PAS domain S-box protein [Ignavibacteriota bacterium]